MQTIIQIRVVTGRTPNPPPRSFIRKHLNFLQLPACFCHIHGYVSRTTRNQTTTPVLLTILTSVDISFAADPSMAFRYSPFWVPISLVMLLVWQAAQLAAVQMEILLGNEPPHPFLQQY